MSLKSIVDYRRHLEEMAREELFAITREVAAQLMAVSRLEGELERVVQEISGGKREGLPADEALALYRFAEALSAELSIARRLAEGLQQQKDAKQASLASAARDCRIVEKLDERRDRERIRVEDRKEQQSHDEASLRRWQDLVAPRRGQAGEK
jgi:flagellar export protein FliJ